MPRYIEEQGSFRCSGIYPKECMFVFNINYLKVDVDRKL
jgi:hypothetical protein